MDGGGEVAERRDENSPAFQCRVESPNKFKSRRDERSLQNEIIGNHGNDMTSVQPSRWDWRPCASTPALKRRAIVELSSWDEQGNMAFQIGCGFGARWESGGGPPQSKTLARWPMANELREASWSAPALWRFGRARRRKRPPGRAGRPSIQDPAKNDWGGQIINKMDLSRRRTLLDADLRQ